MWGKKATSSAETKKFIDWLLDHKINMTEAAISGGKRSGLYAPYDEEERKWLKEISEYATARGIYVMHWTFTAVGNSEDDKDDEAYKNWDCVKNQQEYHCWSNDALIKKRAMGIVQYLKDTGVTFVFIHSVDTTNSKWQDRCAKCRERFGDDRFAADAYIFNQYRDEIRKSFPDMPIIIVPRPYNGNVDDADHIKNGDMKAKGDLQRFSKILAGDIYVCHRGEANRKDNLSWVHTFKQPMYSCVMAWYQDITLSGRDFTPICRYYRTYNYPLADEIANYGVAGSGSRDKIQSLGFSEFTWNLNSPGAAEYDTTPEKYAEIWDPFGEDMSKGKELQALVRRACDDLFGEKYAKYFYNNFLLFTDADFVENYQATAYLMRNGVTPGKGLMPDIDDNKCADFMRRIYNNSDAIIKDMETVKKETADPEIVGAANWYLMTHYPQKAWAHVYMLTLEAAQASKNSEHEKAGKLIAEAFNAYDEESAKLKSEWSGIQGQSIGIGLLAPREVPDMTKARGVMDTIKTRIQSREMMFQRKKNAGAEKNETPRANKPLSAAVFAPDSQGGLTYGRTGLLNLLKGINDISVEEIDNLSPETLKKYDCVIIPDCKSFGKLNVNMNDIRSYVIDHGGGMYFEHDSCGFNRFPLKSSLFPEIADAKDRIGEPISSARYKKSDRTLKIVKQHPVTAGYADGTFYEQVYFDHIQLTNELGTVLVEDTYGKPVIIAGQEEKGKVVFNGGITLSAMDDSELDKPLSGIEGELILNCIYWLAKDKKGTELIMSGLKKEEKILPDREASVISFNPQIVPCKPLHEVILSVQCFNAKDSLPISPKIKIAKIDEITEKWESEENVIVNADSYPQVRVVMELSAKEGRGRVSMLVGGN